MFEQRYEGGLETPPQRPQLTGLSRAIQRAGVELVFATLYALPILLTIHLVVTYGPFVVRMISPHPVSLEDVFPISANRSEIPTISVVPVMPKIPNYIPETQAEPSRPHDPHPVTRTITKTVHHAAGRDKVLAALQNDTRDFDSWRTARLRPNFLSPILGATIDPAHTSPTNPRGISGVSRVYQALRCRLFRNAAAPPPARALAPWNEHGGCWCAAAAPQGRLSIGVRLGLPVVPCTLIVDHVPRRAALDIEKVPRLLDVWGKIAPSFDLEMPTDTWSDKCEGVREPEPRQPAGRARLGVPRQDGVQHRRCQAPRAGAFAGRVLRSGTVPDRSRGRARAGQPWRAVFVPIPDPPGRVGGHGEPMD